MGHGEEQGAVVTMERADWLCVTLSFSTQTQCILAKYLPLSVLEGGEKKFPRRHISCNKVQ